MKPAELTIRQWQARNGIGVGRRFTVKNARVPCRLEGCPNTVVNRPGDGNVYCRPACRQAHSWLKSYDRETARLLLAAIRDALREIGKRDFRKPIQIRRGPRRKPIAHVLATRKRLRRNRPNNSSHHKRARRYGVPYEYINNLKVFRRDGYICGLCGEPALAWVTWQHDLAPELGHIVPLSRGGGHLYANVRCEHRRCNGLKGDMLDSEYRTVVKAA